MAKNTPSKRPSPLPVTSPNASSLHNKSSSRSKTSKTSRPKKSKSLLKKLAKLFLLVFVLYSLFVVACGPNSKADKCPIPPAVLQKVHETWALVEPQVSHVQGFVEKQVVEPHLKPLWGQIHKSVEPQLNKIHGLYEEFKDSPQGKVIFTQAEKLRVGFLEGWHTVSEALVDQVIPLVAENLSKTLEILGQLASKTYDVLLKDVVPLVRTSVASGAKSVRQFVKANSGSVTGPLKSAYASASKSIQDLYKQVSASETVRSIKSQPVVKEICNQYDTLLKPHVDSLSSLAAHWTFKLFVQYPLVGLDAVWKVLENEYTHKDWNEFVKLFSSVGGKVN